LRDSAGITPDFAEMAATRTVARALKTVQMLLKTVNRDRSHHRLPDAGRPAQIVRKIKILLSNDRVVPLTPRLERPSGRNV
jgi:hypothetical protein